MSLNTSEERVSIVVIDGFVYVVKIACSLSKIFSLPLLTILRWQTMEWAVSTSHTLTLAG